MSDTTTEFKSVRGTIKDPTTRLDRIIEFCGYCVENFNENTDIFKANLDKNGQRAFEQSEGMFECAAEAHLAARVKDSILSQRGRGITDDDILLFMQEHTTDELRRMAGFIRTSTSFTANLMERCKLKVMAEFNEKLCGKSVW